MKCAWDAFLSVLPPQLRQPVDRQGRDNGRQLFLRLNARPELILGDQAVFLDQTVTAADLNYVINAASGYSPWAASTLARGYLTAPGGHRIGVCGEAVVKGGEITGIRNISSLCIRVARDFPGISRDLTDLSGSILILGAPGWGKTTLLRDLIRRKSAAGAYVSVVDEREELFPTGFDRGLRTEVLTGCRKDAGIDMLLRSMSPEIIAMDEITAPEDCKALERAAWCGVTLLATAHAGSLQDYLHRSVYEPLVRRNIFEHIVILHRDKSWHLERSGRWTSNGSARC